MEEPAWSGKQLSKLGSSLRDGTPNDDLSFSYNDVRLFFSSLAESVHTQILNEDWRPLLGHRTFEVTSRAKTLDTTVEKLRRSPTTPLNRIQDLAGVRFEAEMSLSQQDAVASTILALFGSDSDDRSIRDLRNDAHSGYRGVHVWLRIPHRVEIQIRTHLQGAWANLYEEAGGYFGRKIRYGEFPDTIAEAEIVKSLQDLSLSNIAQVENRHEALFREELRQDDSARAMLRAERLGIPKPESPHLDQTTTTDLEQSFKAHRATEQVLIQGMEDLKQRLRRMADSRRSKL